jgi:hypothetical protein
MREINVPTKLKEENVPSKFEGATRPEKMKVIFTMHVWERALPQKEANCAHVARPHRKRMAQVPSQLAWHIFLASSGGPPKLERKMCHASVKGHPAMKAPEENGFIVSENPVRCTKHNKKLWE